MVVKYHWTVFGFIIQCEKYDDEFDFKLYDNESLWMVPQYNNWEC